ncbi:hypothetical protein GIB67_019173 [Kingdonia uniflora]|uniref:PH domain-containing protein n=1 Tax=Kingdonia uniflora TaxID=39325 RepID=A0A7J7N028_9MAGN|nr:hypothetical protein GIB67_019173 [Kingdonia uniflora]
MMADHIKACNLSTTSDEFDAWGKCLKGFKHLGMDVRFLRIELKRLKKIVCGSEHDSKERKEALAQQARMSGEIKTLEAKLVDLKDAAEKLDTEVAKHTNNTESRELKLQKELDAHFICCFIHCDPCHDIKHFNASTSNRCSLCGRPCKELAFTRKEVEGIVLLGFDGKRGSTSWLLRREIKVERRLKGFKKKMCYIIQVQTIRQGYLSKRSSSLRSDWKRRFFVHDSRGMLYYYRKQSSKPSGAGSQLSSQRNNNSSELGVCLLAQAESAVDQLDWIEKIVGVITSLLSSQSPEPVNNHFEERFLYGNCFGITPPLIIYIMHIFHFQRLPTSPIGSCHYRSASETSSFESSCDFDHSTSEEYTSERNLLTGHYGRLARVSQQHRLSKKLEKPIDVLRRVCGNNKCIDCGAPDPDWASLNLGASFALSARVFIVILVYIYQR